jgi:hypothetical protein
LGGNEVGHVLEQMESIADGLSGISESIRKAAKK